MSKTNSSFWVEKEGKQPDLLCGKSAEYNFAKEHFTMLMCSIILLGGRWLFLNFILPMPSELP